MRSHRTMAIWLLAVFWAAGPYARPAAGSGDLPGPCAKYAPRCATDFRSPARGRPLGGAQPDFVATANPGLGGRLRSGCTLPVAVELESTKGRISGTIIVEAAGSSESVAQYVTAFEVSPGAAYRYFLYPHCSSPTDTFTLSVRDSDGKVLEHEDLTMLSHNVDSYLVGLLNAGRVAGLGPRPPSDKLVGLEPVLIPGAYMPTRACGYSSADVLVWAHPDPSVLKSAQEKALRDWVYEGGRLVIATGAYWQGAAKSFLSDLLPATLTGSETTKDLADLGTVSGQPLSADAPLILTTISDNKGRVLLGTGRTPLVISRRAGFGEVILVTFDPTKSPFARWAGAQKFWDWLLDLKIVPPEKKAESKPQYYGGYGAATVSNVFARALDDFPKVKPISFPFVLAFLLVYVVLVGPVDYIVLRRLKHLEWTWFTFPAVALVATLVAFWAISSNRTIQTYVNQLSVEDWSADSRICRHYNFATLLSPKNRRYTVSYKAPGAEMSLMEAAGSHGAPGLAIRTPFRMVDLPDWGMTAKDILVPVWSSRTFAARWLEYNAPMAPVSAEVSFDDGKIKARITNYGVVPLENVKVIHSTGVYRVGYIAPGQTREVSGRSSRTLKAFCKENAGARYDYGYGWHLSRDTLGSCGAAAGFLFDRRFFPGEVVGAAKAETQAGYRQELLALDLFPGFGMRSIVDERQAVVTGICEGVSHPLDVGNGLPERWERTVYRICVEVD